MLMTIDHNINFTPTMFFILANFYFISYLLQKKVL